MKRKLIAFGTFALFLIGVTFFASCGNSQNAENQEEHEQMDVNEHEAMDNDNMAEDENKKSKQLADVFACPMHPDVKGGEGDKCSKCGMALKKVEEDHSNHDHD